MKTKRKRILNMTPRDPGQAAWLRSERGKLAAKTRKRNADTVRCYRLECTEIECRSVRISDRNGNERAMILLGDDDDRLILSFYTADGVLACIGSVGKDGRPLLTAFGK